MDFSLLTPPWPDGLVDDLARLAVRVFGATDEADLAWRMDHMPDLSCGLARHGAQLVGFKVGYARTSSRYYSWLGGVHPDYRRQGIGRALMARQHEWLRSRGYAQVETAMRQPNPAMARLNLASGFQVVGMQIKPHGTDLLFARWLTGAKDDRSNAG